jgi:hypothetical protein
MNQNCAIHVRVLGAQGADLDVNCSSLVARQFTLLAPLVERGEQLELNVETRRGT